MRLKIFCLAALAALSSACLAIEPTKEPVSRDGTRAAIDLPASRHIKNVGGSDGSGLCVFTSVQHSADWQNVRVLDGFRAWMERRPGGGWPQKLDQMFAKFAAEKGVDVPEYIQHTGSDAEFLELALKTGRFPAVTYAGRDDFYGGRIAHMVNLAHLDATRAAIVDNNRPGSWVWMTRAEFLARWRDMQGGWAVVLLAPPPPPNPKPMEFAAGPCVCGDSCKCEKGACPGKCPTAFGQCPGGKCPSVIAPQRIANPFQPNAVRPTASGSAPIGDPPTAEHEWRQFDDGSWGWRFKITPAEPVAGSIENHGVDPDKIHAGPVYSIGGQRVTRDQALARLVEGGLSDDSGRYHLSMVTSDAAGARAILADAKNAAILGRVHVQIYGASDWAARDRLRAPLTLQAPAAKGGAVLWSAEKIDAATVAEALKRADPDYREPKPPEPPKPVDPPAPVQPKPVDPPSPLVPAPKPDHTPYILFAIAVLMFLLQRKKV